MVAVAVVTSVLRGVGAAVVASATARGATTFIHVNAVAHVRTAVVVAIIGHVVLRAHVRVARRARTTAGKFVRRSAVAHTRMAAVVTAKHVLLGARIVAVGRTTAGW